MVSSSPRRLLLIRFAILTLFVPGAGLCAAWDVANRVLIEHGDLAIDQTKTLAEITRAQANGGFAAEHGLGLFQNRMKLELAFEAPETALASRRLRLTTRLATTPIIYIAREFPPESCAYRAVLEHELLHQLYDREVLRAMPDEIRAITRQVFAPDALDWARPLDLGRLRDRFIRQFKYVYDGLSARRHQRIDSPEAYRRTSALCGGEITRLVASRGP